MSRQRSLTIALLAVSAVLGAIWFYRSQQEPGTDAPFETARAYLRATYARDTKVIYALLSNADRAARDETGFVKSQGSFEGFTLEVARKLAAWIEAKPIAQSDSDARRSIKLSYRLPAPAELNGLLLDWDQEKLNALPAERQRQIINEIDALHKNRKLVMLDGQEELELVRDGGAWRIFLNWAAATKVRLQAHLDGTPLDIQFAQKEVFTKNDELFLVNLTIKNSSSQPVTFGVSHEVDPAVIGDDLELVECGLLTPVTLAAGQNREYAMAYLLAPSPGRSLREFTLSYRFKRS